MNSLAASRILIASVLLCAIGYSPSSSAQISEVTEIYRSGDTDAALVMLDELRATYPDDVDYMLLRAQIYAQLSNEELALDELRIATTTAPDYEDPWRLRYSLLVRAEGDHYEAERHTVMQQVRSRFPEAEWWQVAESDSRAQWTALVGAGYDRLDNGAPAWNRQFIEVSRDSAFSGRHRINVSRESRFSTSDTVLLVGSDFSLADHWQIGADLAAASNPEFLANSVLGAYVGRSFERGWGITLAYRHRNFSTVNVGSTTVTAERYVDAFRFAYSLSASHLSGAGNSLGHSFTSSWYYNDRSSIGLSISAGTEAEAIGPGRVLESRVRGLVVSGRRELNQKLGLQWWIGLHEQGDFYRRQFLGMAISIKL